MVYLAISDDARFFTYVRDNMTLIYDDMLKRIPCAAATADILATSTAADEDTPLPSGTAEET